MRVETEKGLKNIVFSPFFFFTASLRSGLALDREHLAFRGGS